MTSSSRIRYLTWLLVLTAFILGTTHTVFADQITFLGCQLEQNYIAVYTFQVSGIRPTDQVTALLRVQYFAGPGQGGNVAYSWDKVTNYFSGPGTYQIWNAAPNNPWPQEYAPPNYPWPPGTVIIMRLTVQVPNGQTFGQGYDTETATCNIYP